MILGLCLAILMTASAFAQTQLTVYNRNFAVVKERRALDLKQGGLDG